MGHVCSKVTEHKGKKIMVTQGLGLKPSENIIL